MDVLIRNLRQSDLKQVLKIERASFPDPLKEKDFEFILHKKLTTCLVAETQNELNADGSRKRGPKQIVGYIIYSTEDRRQINLLSLAVSPSYRRKAVGRDLVAGVLCHLGDVHKRVGVTVSDRELTVHLFFKKLNFQAVKVLKDFFGKGHDGYEFVYKLFSSSDHNLMKSESCRGI